MAWTELHPNDLDDLYVILNTLSDAETYVFRGHGSVDWRPVPSLHRALQSTLNPAEMVLAEASAIRAFRRHARSLVQPSELDYFRRILDSLTLMQHYGAPTRLLDWTLSPWVACYFATTDDADSDVALWAFNQSELQKYNHQQRDSRDYARFRQLETATSVDEWASAALRAGPYVRVFRYEYANPQMSAQQSVFTISGTLGDNHDDAIERSLAERWQRLKIIIPKAFKATLRNRLLAMNVGALALFPTLDGVGRSIRERIRSSVALDDEGLLWVLDASAAKRRVSRASAPPRRRVAR